MDWNNWYEELENQGRGVSREMDYTLRNSLNPVGRASMEMRGDQRAKASSYPSLISRFMSNDPTYQGLLQKEEDEKEVQKWMDFAQSENQKNRDYASQVREEAVRDQYLGSMIGRENSEILATQAQSRARENAALQSFENAANRPWQMMITKGQQNQDDLSRLYSAYLGRAV